VGVRLKIPVGALLGALVFTAVFNIIWDIAYMPEDIRDIARIAAGALDWFANNQKRC
jgi:uncharacterized protein